MKAISKNKTIFVATSLAVFVFLAGAYFYFHSLLFTVKTKETAKIDNGVYYLKDAEKPNDPFVTKIPDLKDMLAGPIITDNDPSRGTYQAKVIITVFSDYACSFCLKTEEAATAILDEFPESVKLVRKDYPESDKDSFSWQTAIAARCAGEQGIYWLYHDRLISEPVLTNIDFISLARELNLDERQFGQCLTSEQAAALVVDNMVEADALGIKGVPFVYINDQALLGEVEADELRKVIKMKLEK